jgi:CRISPR-associated protein Csd2
MKTKTAATPLETKIDFAVTLRVIKANPNGDPLNGNRPRTTPDGFGEISDVALRRKARNRRMQLVGDILIQPDDSRLDEHGSIRARVDAAKLPESNSEFCRAACEKWFDVRAFGGVFAFAAKEGSDSVSTSVRGPISIQSAITVDPVTLTTTQITKSTNGEDKKKAGSDDNLLSSDRIGKKHRVEHGIYVAFGAINTQLAGITGFTDEDAEAFKDILTSLFENDASAARPAGSMEVINVFWWKHSSLHGDASSSRVHRSLTVASDGTYTLSPILGSDGKVVPLTPEVLHGF